MQACTLYQFFQPGSISCFLKTRILMKPCFICKNITKIVLFYLIHHICGHVWPVSLEVVLTWSTWTHWCSSSLQVFSLKDLSSFILLKLKIVIVGNILILSQNPVLHFLIKPPTEIDLCWQLYHLNQKSLW